MKVQERKIGDYRQLYVTLPFKLCQAMGIEQGTELKFEVAGKDRLELKKV
ncbi:MAG: hypothetical protein ACE5HY_06170 [Candidatus Hydrothermarchaeales archaeon]